MQLSFSTVRDRKIPQCLQPLCQFGAYGRGQTLCICGRVLSTLDQGSESNSKSAGWRVGGMQGLPRTDTPVPVWWSSCALGPPPPHCLNRTNPSPILFAAMGMAVGRGLRLQLLSQGENGLQCGSHRGTKVWGATGTVPSLAWAVSVLAPAAYQPYFKQVVYDNKQNKE